MHVALILDRINWVFQFVETPRSVFSCCHVPNSDNTTESEGFCYSTRILKSSVCSCVYVTDISLCTIFFLAVLFYRAAKSWHAEPLVSSWILHGLRAWIFISYVGHVIWTNMSGNTHTHLIRPSITIYTVLQNDWTGVFSVFFFQFYCLALLAFHWENRPISLDVHDKKKTCDVVL